MDRTCRVDEGGVRLLPRMMRDFQRPPTTLTAQGTIALALTSPRTRIEAKAFEVGDHE
jgi:hypothetical protein